VNPKIDNGGFPDPPPGEPVRVVRCSHLACGAETRIRLPGTVPASAVRRVICAGCAAPYETATVEEVEAARTRPAKAPDQRRRGWLDRPPSRRWTLIAVPIAAVIVFAGLILVNKVLG
jgi:hypothetical protein